MQFIRVRAKETRHEFDVPESDWRIEAGLFEQVKPSTYPPVAYPRPAHNFVASKGVASKPSVAADTKEAHSG